MKQKRILALILTIAMVFLSTFAGFAQEVDNTVVNDSGVDNTVVDNGGVDTNTNTNTNTDTTIDASKWTSDDFTYTSYEKYLYGCDYTREITIKGSAIAGFSESGEAKLALNTDLVIPAVDDEGYQIVGIAESAFKNKGLTSVTFPKGMMVDYDDTVTHKVTKRGNFVIAESAFAGNNLTSLTLPEGVIAVLPSAFNNNKLTSVRLPKTIWWVETMAFANNRITTVNFPTTCDFQLELHGMVFAKNFIKSVRLPDYTEVVNKDVFFLNLGMEPIPEDAKASYKSYQLDGKTYDAGIVYMYTDNAELEGKDRIHHAGKETASQYSYVQKLVVNDGSDETQNPDLPWNIADFTYEGTVITGLSESGIAKRQTNKDLVIPEINREGQYITEIASSSGAASPYGLFGAEGEGFDSVYLPSHLVKIGDFAFRNNGLKEVTFPSKLETIGISAFQSNELTSVILPDTVTSLGGGAFGTNPKLERISLSKGLTEIPSGAFGCSDAKNWMEKLTSIELHEGITKIDRNAFAGNNFKEIVIPSTVKEIGSYAFSTKNYLVTPCTVTLNEGLETIGSYAFRNKVIDEITLPTTVKKIYKNTFAKEYSDDTVAKVTKVYVSLKSQYEDTTNFPASNYHEIILTDSNVWTAGDFTYGELEVALYPANEYSSTTNMKINVVTGFSETGLQKLESNKDLVIPAVDTTGNEVQGVGNSAFKKKGLTSVQFPENVKTEYTENWTTTGSDVTERGNFFIGASAFQSNALTELELPEGVIYIGGNSFNSNKLTSLTLPSTTMMVGNSAFAKNEISTLNFPETTDFNFQVDTMAFAINKIKAVQLPSNTEKVQKWAFLQNTGMEEITAGTTSEKKGGLVHMYMNISDDATLDSKVECKSAGTSNVQELFRGTIPEVLAAWSQTDFTYDGTGTVITGLSESGKAKIKENPNLVLPELGPTGEAITALGDGINQQGIFVFVDTMGTAENTDDKYYTPASVKLPSSLTKIGKWTFALGAYKYEATMTSIVLPDGLNEIGQTAFQNSKLTSVVLPDSVTTLGLAAYTGSTELTEIKLSASLKNIPNNAFANVGTSSAEVQEIVIPEGVVSIGTSAFAGRHVETLSLPSTLQTIGSKAFENHQLTSITLPNSVTSIGSQAFRVYQQGLDKTLTSITLNEGLTTIGKEAFTGSALTEVALPSTVVVSAKNTSADCIFGTKTAAASPIVKLYVGDEAKVEKYNTQFANNYSHIVVYNNLVGSGWELNDFTYDEATGTVTGWSESGHVKRASLKDLVIPATTPDGNAVVAIGDEAFKIPDNEVVITKFGVDSPEGMKTVVLPATVKKLGAQAFAQNALQEVDLTGLTEIGDRAFYGNDLVKAIIPDTVTVLGDGAFATNDITELKLSSGVTVIPQGAFSMNIRLSSVEIPDTVTEIGDTAFAGARLTSLTIPNSVTKIGRKAFHLHHLTELTIPGNVKEIGESAFEGTYKATTLKSLTIEEGVEVIGKYAFKEGLLENVHFPNSIKEVGDKPFLNNKGKVNEDHENSHVVEVTTYNILHETLKDDTYVIRYIGDYAFEDYADLVELEYASVMFTGDPYEPKVSIPGLVEGKDFSVEYKNNVEIGTATVVITGEGQYVGTIEKTFVITDNPLVAENKKLQDEVKKLKAENDLLAAENKALKAEIKRYRDHKCPSVGTTIAEVEGATIDKDVDTDTDVIDKVTDVGSTEVEESGYDNKFIIGLVIGLIAGGCVCYLLLGKKRREQE
ncbi:MAG: leucine-rich repeat protein [Firmicutes bacterium]|nr:leucine-rich repeat protein [Bacillota bacterium]